ncbi:XIAP-associated factor 1 [Mustelus asterias]
MERCKLETHQGEQCVERMLNCRFCDLETQSRALLEHEEACGSRTNRCGDCGKYVMCREQESHQQTCPGEHHSGFASVPVTEKSSRGLCAFCTKMFPEDQLQQHQNGCRPLSRLVDRFQTSLWQDPPFYPPSRSRPRLSYPPFFTPIPREQVGAQAASPPWRSAFVGSEVLDEIGYCRVCDCALPHELLQQHEMKCRFFHWQRRNGLRRSEVNEREQL